MKRAAFFLWEAYKKFAGIRRVVWELQWAAALSLRCKGRVESMCPQGHFTWGTPDQWEGEQGSCYTVNRTREGAQWWPIWRQALRYRCSHNPHCITFTWASLINGDFISLYTDYAQWIINIQFMFMWLLKKKKMLYNLFIQQLFIE